MAENTYLTYVAWLNAVVRKPLFRNDVSVIDISRWSLKVVSMCLVDRSSSSSNLSKHLVQISARFLFVRVGFVNASDGRMKKRRKQSKSICTSRALPDIYIQVKMKAKFTSSLALDPTTKIIFCFESRRQSIKKRFSFLSGPHTIQYHLSLTVTESNAGLNHLMINLPALILPFHLSLL